MYDKYKLFFSGDGTFKITPWPWYQVFIIHASVGKTSSVPVVFSLLPDKTRRSYDDLFSGLFQALSKRGLQLSANTFMSDFEINIRLAFTAHFKNINPKGCYFHFSKSIWSRVKKAGLQRFYSIKSKDTKFGSFIRSIIGLPFVKIEDLDRALANIIKLSHQLTNTRCKKFADDLILYLKSYWIQGSFSPELWNMFLHKGARTNNICEGYNNKLGNKRLSNKHPNK